jgi:hypothetical protein
MFFANGSCVYPMILSALPILTSGVGVSGTFDTLGTSDFPDGFPWRLRVDEEWVFFDVGGRVFLPAVVKWWRRNKNRERNSINLTQFMELSAWCDWYWESRNRIVAPAYNGSIP